MSAERRDTRSLPTGAIARGVVEPPPSKSVSHRALALALLSGHEARVERLLRAEDTEHFVSALEALGWSLTRDDETLLLVPPVVREGREGDIECGNAGTLFRFLVAILCTEPGLWRIDGSARLRERPVGALVEALRRLGARIEELGEPGCAPLLVEGGSLAGGETDLDAGESSQYLSALLLAGLRARGPTQIAVERLTSTPYVALTVDAIERWVSPRAITLPATTSGTYGVTPTDFRLTVLRVEGDWSAAAYPAAAAALTGGDVSLRRLRRDSPQGDRRFLELLAALGAGVEWHADEVRVQGVSLTSVGEVDLSSMPDQVPTLAALAPFCRGTTRIVGVPHLRLKESDRLHAMATELARLGVPIEERADGLTIEGCWADRTPPATEVEVDTWNDHRIAMSLALVGLRRPGVLVRRPEVVAKSYPDFWRDLERLTRR